MCSSARVGTSVHLLALVAMCYLQFFYTICLFSLTYSLIQSFIYLCQCGLMIFCTLGCSLVLSFSADYWSFVSWLLHPFHITPSLWGFVFVGSLKSAI
jgi:hypothetical protein